MTYKDKAYYDSTPPCNMPNTQIAHAQTSRYLYGALLSVEERVAVCCSVSQCVAVCRSVLQCVAVRSVLQCVAALSSV